MKLRIDDFLSIAQSHGIKPMFVIFDDCWNPESSYGVQPDPKPGVHNSGWVQDPAKSLRNQSKNNCIFKDLCVLENFYNDIVLLSINK